MPGWWRLDDDDGRFAREARDSWVYGPADPRVEGLRVPGAADVTLGEVAPPDIAPRRRRSGFVFFQAAVVAREPALAWVGGPEIGEYVGAPVAEWEPREGEVIGMRAPELGDGFERDLALAEREVRAWRRERTLAARQRGAHAAHARHDLAAAGADIARWIGVTRNRIQQICGVPAAALDGPAPRSLDEAAAAVRAAHARFSRADEMLHRAEARRRLLVAAACDEHGLSLGAVANVLDLSRPRAQQLRDAGRAAAAVA